MLTFHPIDPDAPAAPIRRGEEAEPKRRPLPSLPIETDVPIPPVATRPGYRAQQRHRIALGRLQVDESVYVPGARFPPTREMHRLKARYGRLFAFRRVFGADGELLGIRVWRTL